MMFSLPGSDPFAYYRVCIRSRLRHTPIEKWKDHKAPFFASYIEESFNWQSRNLCGSYYAISAVSEALDLMGEARYQPQALHSPQSNIVLPTTENLIHPSRGAGCPLRGKRGRGESASWGANTIVGTGSMHCIGRGILSCLEGVCEPLGLFAKLIERSIGWLVGTFQEQAGFTIHASPLLIVYSVHIQSSSRLDGWITLFQSNGSDDQSPPKYWSRAYRSLVPAQASRAPR
ncbi:hypothetical protein I7I51_02305 [Histoplasma capsulatum]|uniref:Uncharacterized protein n=1 Tax=Ajellomyces capsulatus TaxID=5037 RepID=A0A8A1MEJ7_AJECA|nr:hypothetical protein I7I51_02305 [Histoplasma capsulatum]